MFNRTLPVIAMCVLMLPLLTYADSFFEIAKKRAEQGDAPAQFYLGVMYSKGQGVKQDSFEALKWYKKSAEQGDAMAQSTVGYMYLKGEGVKQDKSKAKHYFGLACDNKDQVGCDAYRELNEGGY